MPAPKRRSIWNAPAKSLKQGLIAYYDFEVGTGTVVPDRSGNQHTGAWAGGSTGQWVAGAIGGGSYCNGANNYVVVPLTTGLSGSFSVSCWVKLPSTPTSNPIALSAHAPALSNYWFTVEFDGNTTIPSFYLYDGSHNPQVNGTSLSLNVWAHVVAVRDTVAGNVRVYTNGSPGSAVSATITTQAIDALLIGCRERGIGTFTDLFTGYLDEIGIWSRALSANEVAQLYNQGLGYRPC